MPAAQLHNRLAVAGSPPEDAAGNGLSGSSNQPGDQDDDQLLRRALEIKRLRAARYQLLRPSLFGEPAWDMLLDLYILRAQRQKVSVTALCLTVAAPPTTALRYLHDLIDGGEVSRRADPRDRRRVFIELSAAGLQAMRQVLRSE